MNFKEKCATKKYKRTAKSDFSPVTQTLENVCFDSQCDSAFVEWGAECGNSIYSELYYVNQKQNTDNDYLKSFPYLVPE